jgi:hypothetical protein
MRRERNVKMREVKSRLGLKVFPPKLSSKKL